MMRQNLFTVEGLKAAILGNNFTLPEELKKSLTAVRTDMLSGILRRGGRCLYFNIIRPWFLCPSGRVEVEVC